MQIRLIPRNGLGNRLQAITSAILLADQTNSEPKILWAPETLLPLEAEEIFSKATLSKFFEVCTPVQINSMLSKIPELLTTSENEIFLRGNRLGEQKFMKRLAKLLSSNEYQRLTIVAGGQFELNRKSNSKFEITKFQHRRTAIYRELNFRSDIYEDEKRLIQSLQQPYIALHLRGTDRANQAIANNRLVVECIKRSKKVGVNSFLVVGDSADRILKVNNIFHEKSICPKIFPSSEISRTSVNGSRMAILDWLLLKNAHLVVSSASSTFSIEASIAGGTYQKSTFIYPPVIRRARNAMKDKFILFRKYKTKAFTG